MTVYQQLTSLGDTNRYLTSGLNWEPSFIFSSTALMDFVGGAVGGLLGGSNIISNLPFTILSFITIKWAVQYLSYDKLISKPLLIIIISLPNFCIWTSVFSKELVGLVFSAIFGVLIINFLEGRFKIRARDCVATYLCLLFKPQYFVFIVQALVTIYFMRRIARTSTQKTFIGITIIILNFGALYLFRDEIDGLAQIMPIHFFSYEGNSNRFPDYWSYPYSIFLEAPYGMFISFFGPTFSEMLQSPNHFVAGIESFLILGLFFGLLYNFLIYSILRSSFNIVILPVYFMLIIGICFVHYPFGIFNSGSAIRYRTNFLFLFFLLFLYLFKIYSAKSKTLFK